MPDVAHYWGQDLQVSASGDLFVVSGDTETQQRILRRLFTNLGDYIWQLNDGGGLPAMVSAPQNAVGIVALEATVASTPVPVVTVVTQPNGTTTATIQYADAVTGQTNVLQVPVS
jgi:hypothetical protein